MKNNPGQSSQACIFPRAAKVGHKHENSTVAASYFRAWNISPAALAVPGMKGYPAATNVCVCVCFGSLGVGEVT